MAAKDEGGVDEAARRRRIAITTVLLALVALGFYASIFLSVGSRH